MCGNGGGGFGGTKAMPVYPQSTPGAPGGVQMPFQAPFQAPGNNPYATGQIPAWAQPTVNRWMQQWQGLQQPGYGFMQRPEWQQLQQRFPMMQRLMGMADGGAVDAGNDPVRADANMATGGVVKRKGKITLTPEEIAFATSQGISLEDYAWNKLQMLAMRNE